MDLDFTDVVFEWRGPSPYHFVRVPDDDAAIIQDVARAVTYGWGMVPVVATLGETSYKTALWPREGSYVVPLRADARTAEGVGLGDVVRVRLHIDV